MNADALYKQYQDRYTQLGKTAMEDTLGRASALTGGYGSSYAPKVGQQAYQSYLSKSDDVIPELYRLAYERYRDESKRLYQTYQSWAQQEQQAAQQERWEQEYALAQQKLRAENARQEGKNSQTQTTVTQPDYWAMLSYHQNLGKSTESKSTATNSTATNSIPDQARYDNGKVSEGNIKTMQRLLGLTDTGKWTSLEQETAGNRSADDAWLDYQQGKLQSRSKSGMSMEKWATYRNEQSKASTAADTKGTTSRVENFIAGMVTEDQAAERGVSSEDWKRTVMERLNRVSLSVDEFEQLESYYGLGIASGTSNTPVDSSAPKMSYSEYREKTATKKVADLNTAVQRYFRDYQAFADSALYDLQNADYHNAETMRDIRVQTAKELRKKANTLASTLHMNSDIIPGDYNKLHSLIASTQTGVGIIMDTFDSQVKHYSQWATEEEYKYQNMSPDEIMAEQKARAAMIKDFGIVFELSRTNMPYDWTDAEYWGYTRADFDEVDRKRKYIEEKYGVDLYTDIYESEHIYNDLLDELASLDTDIAYTTADGQNVTLQMLYDWKLAEEKSAVWQQKYSDKSYAELQKVIAGLAEGEEKSWLLNYAEAKKTKDDWEKELSHSHAELDYLLQLQTERDRLMEWQAMSSVETPGYVELKKRWESYHNQFDGLDERIDALEKKIWKQERIVRYYDLSQNEDFAEKSQYHGGGSVLQQMVNHPEMIGLLDNAAAIGKKVGSIPGVIAGIYDDLTFDNLQYMENTERADFNYLNETEGDAAAKEYLQWLQPTLNERSMNKKMERVSAATQSIPVLSQIAASLWSTPMKLVGGGLGLVDVAGQNIRNTITGENKPIDYNTDAMFYSKAASTIRKTVAQDILDATGSIDLNEEDHPILSRLLNGKSLADVYQFGMGVLDSTAVVALAAINPAFGKAGVALLSTSSGTDAMLDAVSRGASDEQALTMGILTAGFEMIFEKYELESLLGQGTNVWQACWRQGLSGIVSGSATGTANLLADIAVMAEKSDYQKNIQHYLDENPDWDYRQAKKQAFIDAALQVGGASLVEGISGGIMGAGYSKIQNVVYNGKQSQVNTQPVNHTANISFNQQDVAKRLMDKGFNPEKAAKMADAITARLNGQELTRIQTDRLRSAMDSAVVRDVMSDITKRKADGIDSVQNNVYDSVGDNKKRYEVITADAAPHQVRNASSEGTDGGVDGVITDGSHLENGKLKPNVTYKSGEHDYFYTTNEDGLIVNARADDLQKKTHKRRLKHNPNTYGKKAGDHAGHLFGDQFGGSPELDNLVSQAKNVNLSEYRKIENRWAKALKNGQKVTVNIDIHYDQGGVRPISFEVLYTIDGVRHRKIIKNQ